MVSVLRGLSIYLRLEQQSELPPWGWDVFLGEEFLKRFWKRSLQQETRASSSGPLLPEFQGPAILTDFTGSDSRCVCAVRGEAGPCSNDRASLMWPWLDLAVYPQMSWSRDNTICHLKQELIWRMGLESLYFPLWTAMTKKSTFKGQLMKLLFWPSFLTENQTPSK